MYSFTIVFKQQEHGNTFREIRCIYCGNACIVAKNAKYGGIYLHKKAKIIKGKFFYNAGSHNYPRLVPVKDEVHIRVENFHASPHELEPTIGYNNGMITIINYEANNNNTRSSSVS